ncbi:MAG: TAT-variant-translocated molybdopterin oxidoreductase [Bacteroidota bacterium]|nr:TAT-variant-translocated molybdopterin oxidoreductase [Bacteroidota bacterium]
MSEIKKYWKSLSQLNEDPIVKRLSENEFVEELPVDKFLGDKKNLSESQTSRRDFLKFLGFSTAAATLAACENPIKKSIPYVIKPEEITPGIANYYASTIYDGYDYASVLVKTREGRPIKIENNGTHSNARVQASVLSLYDSGRLQYPLKSGKEIDWKTLDNEVKNKLQEIRNGKIILLTSSILSPSTKQLLQNFINKYNRVEHAMFDSVPYDGILNANQESFGIRAIPSYKFHKTNIIVSFGADFLGNWGANNYASDYVGGRNPKSGKMSRHYQLETNLSLTGANADKRIQIKPSEQAYLLSNLYAALNGSSADKRLKSIVKDLKKNTGKSIVLSDSNDKNTQLIVNAINQKLSNYSKTLDISIPCYLKQGDTERVHSLIREMELGEVSALITYNVNPAYTLADNKRFIKALKQVNLTVSTSSYNDETAELMDYVAPDHHNLESWGDAKPYYNYVSLMQPTISPLFNTRQFQDSIISWAEMNEVDYYSYLKKFWSNKGIKWNQALHDGDFNLSESKYFPKRFVFQGKLTDNKTQDKNIEIALYESIALGDGAQANNPWLQEFPDPITRACWDNYITISPSTARDFGLKNWNISNGALNGSLVNIKSGNISLNNLPVMIQPGQANKTIGMAVGYGRKKCGKAGEGIGFNANNFSNSNFITIEKIEGEYEFACTQLHHTMMGRDIVKETTLADYIKDPSSGNERLEFSTYKGKLPSNKVTLYDEHDLKTGHFWNLSIDLSSCIGCGECVVSCQAENNIPVVGKEEVRKSRDMHWLRIDRYFSSEMTKELAVEEKISAIDMFSEMEEPSENPEVVFQPVMCQHCNSAPCENVCPVAATTHSSEGLNQMTYNRCVGTRYCANNCPYKVRRFNWFQYAENEKFDYHMNDDYGKMVLNPDVVVRSRGVIEKCSMCIQRIQDIKLEAKKNGDKIKDKDAQTACSAVCGTNALVFGDRNDQNSEVAKLREDERAYDLLDHLNVRPSVFYQTKVRNKG